MIQSEFEMYIDDYSLESEFDFSEGSYEELCWKFHLGARAYAIGESKYLKFNSGKFDFQSKTPHHCNVEIIKIKEEEYTSINGALHYMYCATGSDAFAQHKILKLLADGSLNAVQAHSAPPHPNWDLHGDISQSLRDRSFWGQTWWFGKSSILQKAPPGWKGWLLDGGIVIPLSPLERQCLIYVKKRSYSELKTCRILFPDFMPAIDLIFGILHPEKQDDILNKNYAVNWEEVIARSEEESGEYEFESIGQKSFRTMIRYIIEEGIICYRACIGDNRIYPTPFGDAEVGCYMYCSNSAGIFGFDDLDSFAIFSREQISSIFSLSRTNEYREVGEDQIVKVRKNINRTYNDDKIVNFIADGVEGGSYDNAYHGTTQFLRNYKGEYGGIRGNSFNSSSDRIYKKVLKALAERRELRRTL